MGNTERFLKYKRKQGSYAPVDTRLKNYQEFIQQLPSDELKIQAARCMDCGIPFCHALGCPLGNLIPEWNDNVYKGTWEDACKKLQRTNNFPEITGRVCPATCEAACTLSISFAPVTIRQLELAIVEKGFENGWIKPLPPIKRTGKKVAIIGSGPAGLAAAQQLRREGHSVVIFEKDKKIGGLLRYGIPDFKLEKTVLDRRIEQMRLEGVDFQTDVNMGIDISARYLKKSFDAILLAMGAREPRGLNVEGSGFEGIYYALEYLKSSNKYVGGEIPKKQIISAKDKTVLVIGGGDTGNDCVGTANRQGAKKVYQFEILPKPKAWNKDWNPEWPEWPNILRTSSSHEEGCERKWCVNAKGFKGKKNTVSEGSFIEVEWKKDKDGKFTMEELKGTEFSLKIDMVLIAMGFVHVRHGKLLEDLEVKFDTRQNVEISNQYSTNISNVFAAGDAASGASLVVKAINQGREAAKSINEYLCK